MRLFCFIQANTFCRYGCIYFLAELVLVYVDVMVPGMLVCSSFLISVCMFIVSKALLISSALI